MTTCGDAAARTASSIAIVRATIIFDRLSMKACSNRPRRVLGTPPERKRSTRWRAGSGSSASAVGSVKPAASGRPSAIARAMHTITAV